MPSVPIAMPSVIVGVPKICGVAAGLLDARRRRASASFCRPELHGVIVEWPLATPIIGLLEVAFLVAHARSTSSGSARARRLR